MFPNKIADRNSQERYDIENDGVDVDIYFNDIKRQVKRHAKNFNNGSKKIRLTINCDFNDPIKGKSITPWFNSGFFLLVSMNQFDDIYDAIKDKFKAWIAGFQQRGSGFVFIKILQSEVILVRLRSLRGSSYFELPDSIKNNKYIINIQNKKDDKCFLWSIICYIYRYSINSKILKNKEIIKDQIASDSKDS